MRSSYLHYSGTESVTLNKMKVKSQITEPLQGIALINDCTGFNFKRRHK